jgi:hypothetical protein
VNKVHRLSVRYIFKKTPQLHDFLKAATENTQDGAGGLVNVEDGKSVVEQLWPTLRLIISSTNLKMVAMMHSVGFSICR